MKKLLFLFAFPFFAFAQKSDEVAIKALIQESFDQVFSFQKGVNLDKYYTEDFILLEHGEVWNMDTIRNYVAKSASMLNPPKRTNSFEIIKIEINGNIAWAAYHNYALISNGSDKTRNLYWLESGSFVKIKGQWKMKMLHSTRAPMPKKEED